MEKYFPAEKIILTGNPVRKDISGITHKHNDGLKHFGFVKEKPVVLIIGGSLGARTINQAMENNLPTLPDNIQFLWQTGKLHFEKVKEKLTVSGRTNVVALPFIREMDLAYASADIIVSRAGAGTISELAIAGKPVILIPSPNVAEDHQTRNALALVEKNAAILIKDIVAIEKLVSTIIQLTQDVEWRRMLAENIKMFAIPDAAHRIAREVLKIAGKQ
jgi:UDP-N-acetylglucosamine--N-acetylmuramyl-(pentapeptide) pyrophosphoryl-undecaprenol N-acetylglucosamine transferase